MARPSPPLSKDPVVDRSLRHSLRDGIFFSAMIGTAENYFSAFAVFLRASTAQVAWLAALPPVLAAFSQLGSAWLGHRIETARPEQPQRRRLIVIGALLQAFVLIPLALLPLALPELALPVLITCAVVYYIGPNLGSPHWGSLMGDLVPESRRGRYFALRTRLSSLANFSALLGAGLTLHAFDALGKTYGGFLVIFFCAAAFRLTSAWHLQQMYDPAPKAPASKKAWGKELRSALRQTSLLRFSLFYATMQAAVALASPFFSLYMLRDLEFSYLAFMVNTAASMGVQFLTLSRWGRLSDLFGNRLILGTTGLLIPLLPSLWVLSPNPLYLLLVQAISGLAWAGFTLSATNSVFDLTPPESRRNLMAVHNVLAALGVFVGATLGGWLGTVLPGTVSVGDATWPWLSPLYGVFLISTVARLAVVFAFLPQLKELRKVRPMSRSGLIFRVTRIQPLSGMVFEVVGRFRRKP